jgi:hypothetical protein
MNVQILGQKELAAKLHRIGGPNIRKLARKISMTAMAPVLKTAKDNAPMGPTGRLKASIGRLASRNKRGDAFTARVGTRRDFAYRTATGEHRMSGRKAISDKMKAKGMVRDKKTAQQYARVIEFGKDRKGRIRRRAGPAMFLENAILTHQRAIIGTVSTEFRRHLASAST